MKNFGNLMLLHKNKETLDSIENDMLERSYHLAKLSTIFNNDISILEDWHNRHGGIYAKQQ